MERRLSGLGVYAEFLADLEFQEVSEGILERKERASGRDV
jgi:hypothetical protein